MTCPIISPLWLVDSSVLSKPYTANPCFVWSIPCFLGQVSQNPNVLIVAPAFLPWIPSSSEIPFRIAGPWRFGCHFADGIICLGKVRFPMNRVCYITSMLTICFVQKSPYHRWNSIKWLLNPIKILYWCANHQQWLLNPRNTTVDRMFSPSVNWAV